MMKQTTEDGRASAASTHCTGRYLAVCSPAFRFSDTTLFKLFISDMIWYIDLVILFMALGACEYKMYLSLHPLIRPFTTSLVHFRLFWTLRPYFFVLTTKHLNAYVGYPTDNIV